MRERDTRAACSGNHEEHLLGRAGPCRPCLCFAVPLTLCARASERASSLFPSLAAASVPLFILAGARVSRCGLRHVWTGATGGGGSCGDHAQGAGRREGWSGQGSRDPGRPRFLFLSRVWRKTVLRVDATPGELTRIFLLTEGAAAASLAVPPRGAAACPPLPPGEINQRDVCAGAAAAALLPTDSIFA